MDAVLLLPSRQHIVKAVACDKRLYLEEYDQFQFKGNHPYYYPFHTIAYLAPQVQCQLFCTEYDFIVWQKKDLHVERVY